MLQGNIAKWRVKEGDVVAPGLLYADVETDKATIEWESQEDGFIAKLLVADGAQNIEVRTDTLFGACLGDNPCVDLGLSGPVAR